MCRISSLLIGFTLCATAGLAQTLDIGSRRELMVDDFLVDRFDQVALRMHKPEPKEVVIVCDAPWEGNTSGYYTLFQDGDLYRMYYRGAHYDEAAKKGAHAETTCYAESKDGISWTKPKLGLYEFNGSKDNNIILTGGASHNFACFKDTNPNAAPDARYKGFGSAGGELGQRKKKPGLEPFKSADGVRWVSMQTEPVITAGAFDSQNIAFYDTVRGEYRAYWRYFTAGYTDERGWKPSGVRAIRTATSRDYLHWENQADLAYGDAPVEQLYTNAVMPYERAPHLFIGFPTRYQPKHQQVEPIFMSSRDGVNFKRWPEPLIPITAPKDRDGNRSNYMTRGLLFLPGDKKEMSVYATEAYYTGPGSRVRRFTFRIDGFVSAHSAGEGALLTKPLTFAGAKLSLNIAGAGPTRVEIQDASGQPIPGFTLADCTPISTDAIDHTVTWKGGSLAPLAGKAVRLKVALQKADLYALQFQP
jgi:hypothetical protein